MSASGPRLARPFRALHAFCSAHFGRRRDTERFHRHGMVRPTPAVAVSLGIGSVLCYAGLVLDDTVLMAATVSVLVALVLDLGLTLTAWLPSVRSAMARWLDVRCVEQWARLNQHGEVVARFAGQVPATRGWYRCESQAVTWHGPFRLFVARRIEPGEGETVRLPKPQEKGTGRALSPDPRMAGASHTENAGGVREYVAGDPPKLISWRHTAHRGELMTRETSRDSRAVTLLAFDTDMDAVGGMDGGALDRAVALALAYLGPGRSSNTPQPVACDGASFHEGTDRVRRFLAAVQPWHDDARRGDLGGDGLEDGESSATRATVSARAIAGYASRHHGPLQVVLFTADCAGAFPQAVTAALPGEKLHIVEVPLGGTGEETERPDRSGKAVHSEGGAASPAPMRFRSRLAAHVPAFTRAACLLAFFGLSLQGLTGLIQPAGAWPWVCGSLLALAAVTSQIRPRTRVRAFVRVLAFALIAFAVTAVTVCVRYRQDHGIWLFDLPAPADSACQSAGDGSGYALRWLCGMETGAAAPGLRTLLGMAFSSGFHALNLQLPPLSVSVDSDILLVAGLALAAIIVRYLLLFRRAVPCLAVLPVAILAADYGFVGHKASWWAIGLLVLVFPLSLVFRSQPPCDASERIAAKSKKPTITAALASLLAAALTLGLTPMAETIAYRVPLSFGEGGGLFSSNTVNPMIDLKRSLVVGSDETVLTYQAGKRVYLRMTTLGDFNGDTWNFDERLARDGGFYGSGIRLGRDEEDELRWWERMSQSTVGLYTAAQNGQSGDGSYIQDEQTGASSANGPFSVLARIGINTLDSRFLPMPDDGSGAIYGSGLNVGSDWVKYSDGTVYNREHGTNDGMSYSVAGNGLEPITNASGFSQIDAVDDMYQELADDEAQYEREMETRRDVRERYAADHPDSARVKDGWLLIDALWHPGDGTLTVDGETAYETNRYSFDNSDNRGVTDAFAERFAVGDRETVVFGIAPYNYNAREDPDTGQTVYDGPDIDAKLMLRVEEDTESDVGTDGSEQYSASPDAAVQRLYRQAVELMPVGWKLGAFGDEGNGSYLSETTPAMRYLRPVLEAADQRAEQYLSLPDNLPANVRDAIAQARRDGLPAKAKGHDGRVAAMRWLVDYFTGPDQGFVYTLDAPDGDGRDNMSMLNRFLDPERGHKGYCQHYASALAVLGRALGVPTRIVLGYNKGVGEPDGNGEYQVAAKQLHAWTEAYIERVGWVPFDVTPASTDNGSAAADDGVAESVGTISPDSGDRMQQTQAVPQGGGTHAQSEDSSDTDSSDGEEDGGATRADDGDEPSGASQSGDSARGWWTGLPIWARVGFGMGGALTCALLAAAMAVLWGRRSRKRVLAALARAVAAPDDLALRNQAWRLAWLELRRTAGRGAARARRPDARADRGGRAGRGRGGRFDGNLTDMQMAERMAQSNPDMAETIRMAARAAAIASFGGTPPAVSETVAQSLSRAMLRKSGSVVDVRERRHGGSGTRIRG